MKTLIVIDGNAIVHRAFHAIPPLTTREGAVVNAVYGFTSILLRALRELKPDYVAVTFDTAGATFRHARYAEYKATRVKQPQELYDQIPLIKKVVHAFGFCIFEKSGFEADDVIATIARLAQREDRALKIIIITGDMDTLQLVDAHTEVRTMKKGVNDIAVYDEAAVRARYGLSPAQMTDYKGLRGDTSDNIKGVPGIGEKTASELVARYGTLEDIYRAIERGTEPPDIKPSVAEKLRAHKKEAFESRDLVILDRRVPLAFDLASCAVLPYDREQVVALLRAFDFHSLIARLDSPSSPLEAKKKKKQASLPPFPVMEITSEKEYAECIARIDRAARAACVWAQNGSPHGSSAAQGCAVALPDGSLYFIAASHYTAALWNALEHCELYVADLKTAMEALDASGFYFNPRVFVDIELADYVAHAHTRNHEFARIVSAYTGIDADALHSQGSLFGIDMHAWGEKARLLFKTAELIKEELASQQMKKLYDDIEMPLVRILADMERIGIRIDARMLDELSAHIAAQLTALEQTIYQLAGRAFNIASPQQLQDVLFHELHIPDEGIRRGKTGVSTAASELEKMKGMHPIVDRIMEYREYAKLKNTYTDVLPGLAAQDGRIHTTFNQTVAATGRLSSSDPNLQNIPIKTELGRKIRSAFIAESGFQLIKADYSQIELRIIASLSRDAEMMRMFARGEDVHRATAARINNVEESEVTFEMRQAAKAINFGIIYGLGPHGLAEGAHVSFAEAKDFIERYFKVFKGVKAYLEETKLKAHAEGYVETLFGRRRYLPEIHSTMHQVRAGAERMAINAPVQGTAADIIKLAMIATHAFLTKHYAPHEARMVLQVHDELVFEVKDALVSKIVPAVKRSMEQVVALEVPVIVDMQTGAAWGGMERV